MKIQKQLALALTAVFLTSIPYLHAMQQHFAAIGVNVATADARTYYYGPAAPKKAIMAGDQEDLALAVKENRIPTFVCENNPYMLEQERTTSTDKILQVGSDHNRAIALRVLVGKNRIRMAPMGLQPSPDIDALATLYTLALGYNSHMGTYLAQTWQLWRQQTPVSFVYLIEHYLHAMRNDFENKAIEWQTKNPDQDTTTPLDTGYVDRMQTVFKQILPCAKSEIKISDTDREFVINMAAFFMGATPDKKTYRSVGTASVPSEGVPNSYRARWASYCKSNTVGTLQESPAGQEILEEMKKNHHYAEVINRYLR